MSPVLCPPRSRLECLFLGGLSEDELSHLEQHVLECRSCLESLHEQIESHDTLSQLLRDDRRSEPTVPDAEVRKLIARLRSSVAERALSPWRERGKGPAAEDTSCAADSNQNETTKHDSSLTDFLCPPQSEDELGRLGGFRILEVLGHGGMGVVFRGEDPKLGRSVAIKALLPHLAGSKTSRERFLREARAAAALEHDHIVPIFQVGEDRGAPIIVMPFLSGESLDARLKRADQPPLPEVLRIGREIAEGLAAAHQIGLVHRDIKPANIWLESKGQGSRVRDEDSSVWDLPADPSLRTSTLTLSPLAPARVKILDFGLAREVSAEAGLTMQGAIVGTPAYMSPEQAEGRPVDSRTDLFSLGVVLYRLSTGRQPFEGTDAISTLIAVRTLSPAAPIRLSADLPQEFSDLVMQLLEKDPANRPAAAHVVVDRLAATERSIDQERACPSAGEETRAPARRGFAKASRPTKRITALLAAAVVLLGGILAALVILRTPSGDYIIETDDPHFVFQVIRGGGVILEDRKTERVYQMKVLRREKGEFDLQVADDANHVFETKTFTIRRGQKVRLKAWIARKQEASATTTERSASALATDDWTKEVAALRPDQQLKAVMVSLKALNPGFDGKETHAFDSDAVIELHFCTDKVVDISPVRVLTGLQRLTCAGSENRGTEPQGMLYSLSALKGLKLTWLNCGSNRELSRLGPLKGMPLEELRCDQTKVADLSPLKGMRLRVLNCDLHTPQANVSDLSPLEGMPLEVLKLGCQSLIHDLSPLAHTRLNTLLMEGTRVRDLSPLKELPLTELHITWSDFSDLSPLKDVRSLEVLNCNETRVRDLRSLRGLRLARLYCRNTLVSDLAPLRGMPVWDLDIVATQVADLSVLKELPLKKLKCDFRPDRDTEILRFIETLETINDRPAAEVLK